jgi:hypothetical protein
MGTSGSGRRPKGITRRDFTGRALLAAGGLVVGPPGLSGPCRAASQVPPGPRKGAAVRFRPDLVDSNSPKGLEVIQLTIDADVPAAHLYMEAQVFTMDSKRFVLHRSATAHGGSKNDPKHQYLRCDIDDHFTLHPLTEETGVTAASVTPDGKYVYYFVDETRPGGGRLTLKRVNLDGTHRQTILVIDKPLPGSTIRPSQIYPLSTLSSDGKRLALSAFFGDGRTENAPWGLMVFDLTAATVRAIVQGPTWCNMHPQYCRSTDPEAMRDILIQENHGCAADAGGGVTCLVSGLGADIHVIRDDGTRFRDLPWGRDGNEFCQGHQCWRGRTTWAITSTGTLKPPECQLIEGREAVHAGHAGIGTPGGIRNDLSRGFRNPHFYHFGTDIAGRRLISDGGAFDKTMAIYVGDLGRPGKDAIANFRYLLTARSSCQKGAHIHPFLSPDGTLGLFNSDESGLLQAYLVRGF